MVNQGKQARFAEEIADRRRVCCCICPALHGTVRAPCQGFIEPGETFVMETMGDFRSARCLPCARILGYEG